ncbi:MAG TPA: FtsX-like permease family protein [Vicinamibacteria bacterium]|nr:FtsX-like permease family protein [Vicinamibacteria bacterium]
MSRIRFVLALAGRESRASRRRGLLIVLAVAVGTGALVAINSFTDNLRESIRREARALLGADLTIWSSGPFSERAESLLAEARAATTPPAEVARVVSFGAMAFVPGGQTTRLVQVLAVDPGYPFYGAIETAPAGEWARLAETGGAVADGSLLVALGARVGDEVAIGGARFVLRATIENMPGDVGLRTAIGPRVFVPRSRVEETGLLTRGSRGHYEAYLRLPPGTDAQKVADRLRPRLLAERLGVRTVAEDQRRLGETLSRFGRFLGLVALVALLLGGLGVASAVHVFIRRRMATVAVLRCLGATGGTVLAAYVVQAVAVGLVGSLAGAALGAGVQAGLPRVLKGLLPVDVPWAVSWPAVLGGVGVGVWVATVFSLLPLLPVRHVSPLAVLRRDYEDERPRRDPARLAAALALAASVVAMAVIQAGRVAVGLGFAAGVGTALAALGFAALLLVRGLRRFFPQRLPYLYRQGIANLYRPANQTLMVVLALGFGAFLLSTLVLVQHNLLRGLRVDRGASRPNVVFFDVQPDQRDDVTARVAAAGSLTAPVVPIVPMRIASLKGRRAGELLAMQDEGRRPERWALRREYRSSYRDTPAASERILAGAWWRAGQWKERREGETVPIAMEAGLARELKVAVGDEIVWDVQGVEVPSRVSVLREVEWARFEPNFFVVFPAGPLDAAPQSAVLLARVEDPARRARLQRAVVEAHPNVSTLDLAQVQHAIEGVLDKVALAIRFIALFSIAAGALVLAGAVAASRYQRVREGALLRTLGARRSQLLLILLSEYAVLGTLAAGAAILLSTAAGWALVRFVFDQPFAVPGPGLFGLLVSVLALTLAVGLAGSTEVWRRPPLEVLRAE